MDNNEIRYWISRILSGTVELNGVKYKVPKLNEASEIVYQETFSDAIFFGCWTQAECEKLIDRKDPKKIAEEINSLKIEIYNLRKNESGLSHARKKLAEKRKELNKIILTNTRYYNYSAEYIASYARDVVLMGDDVIDAVNEKRPTEKIIREIARSGLWYSMWSTSKIRMFPRRMTDDQTDLVFWTQKYINILKGHEPPESYVIDDDDMLDGWMLSNVKEEQKPEDTIKGEGDIFLFAKTPGDAEKIHNMNDPMAKMDIARRKKLIEDKGAVNEADLPDIKREQHLRINRGN